jgi:glutamate N-acetyltransferase/amino-acid N-acetyltransferase
MVSIFSTGKIKHSNIKDINDEKLKDFDTALNKVLLNLAKRVVSDGEGASKFISINVKNCKKEDDAKKIAFSISNSPLVKTAIAGEDPNWGRVVMAVGKAGIKLDLENLSMKFGDFKIVEKGQLYEKYNESEVADYMKGKNIDITVFIETGTKSFTSYTMDFTKKYIEINADYRS